MKTRKKVMNSKLLLNYACLLLAGGSLWVSSCRCGGQEVAKIVTEVKTAAKITSATSERLADKPLVAYQNKLLDLAFETATVIPVNPHIKDRSLAQQKIIETCLSLDQPQRVGTLIESIDNWRRNLCYAHLAFYYATHGDAVKAQRYLEIARQITGDIVGWRRGRIRVKIAQTHALLGQKQQAEAFNADLDMSEIGKLAGTRAMVADEASFDEQVKVLDNLIDKGDFDITQNALASYAQLFNRFYNDSGRRNLVEDRIKNSGGKIPLFVRIKLLSDLAGFALDHKDADKALEFVDQAQQLMDSVQWSVEHRIPRLARLIILRFRAGDTQKARADADAAMILFETKGHGIVNIYRATVLRSLAEAYQEMGDTATARSIYKKAIEQGAENPNSRPRAEDLSATCGSMALYALKPDAELWDRIYRIKEELVQPW